MVLITMLGLLKRLSLPSMCTDSFSHLILLFFVCYLDFILQGSMTTPFPSIYDQPCLISMSFFELRLFDVLIFTSDMYNCYDTDTIILAKSLVMKFELISLYTKY